MKYYKEKDYIHYSNCHEDPDILLKSIKDSHKTVLSIASAGDNSFSLLTKAIDKIYVFDKNPSQIALTKLKATAIKYLDYEEFLELLGVTPGNPYNKYLAITKYLDSDTKEYFDKHLFLLDWKLIHCGRFEHYFQVFRKYVLRITHSKKVLNQFFACTNTFEQWQFYQKNFNNLRWKLLFKVFFSRFLMSKVGRDKEFFKYCKTSLSKQLKARVELGFMNVLNRNNPYLQYAVNNQFNTLPHYLRKENYQLIKDNIDKMDFVCGDIATVHQMNLKFDFMNLSDIFEYMSEAETLKTEKVIHDMCNDKAIIVFWNMIVPRRLSMKQFVSIDSQPLFLLDKAFYYQALYIYEVQNEDNRAFPIKCQ